MAMSVAAATHDEPVPGVVADAVHLPIRDSAADLVVAFMSLHDIDDLEGSVAEIAPSSHRPVGCVSLSCIQ